jgi:sugar/nucleoside kinase (ribokinase family)
MSETGYDVLGIGNALVDVIARVDEAFISTEGLRKSTMKLLDTAEAEGLYSRMPSALEASGGAAANTLAGLASLGGRAAFIGRVADDQLGRVFRHDMQANGTVFSAPPVTGDLPTGRCLILVTPDGERTMNTYLGTAANLSPADLDPGMIAAASITYLEGYLFNSADSQAAFFAAGKMARAAGRQVALSPSDVFCIEGHRAKFQQLVADHVDILFANEAEICSLYETDFETAVGIVCRQVDIACLTRGAAGSLIVRGDETIEVPAVPTEVVDTTGAGDLYAAGFLYGYTQGMSLADCGRYGAIAAAEVISHMGARPLVNLGELVKQRTDVR